MSRPRNRILAIAPVHRGFGLVVLDTAGTLLDWRVKEIREKTRHKNARCLVEIDNIIEEHRPIALTIEDYRAPGSKKRKRVRELLDLLTEHAIDSGIGVAKYGPKDIRISLGLNPMANKLALAKEIAKRVPLLKPRTPKQVHIWQNEVYAMPISVAAALALTHQSRAQRREPGR